MWLFKKYKHVLVYAPFLTSKRHHPPIWFQNCLSFHFFLQNLNYFKILLLFHFKPAAETFKSCWSSVLSRRWYFQWGIDLGMHWILWKNAKFSMYLRLNSMCKAAMYWKLEKLEYSKLNYLDNKLWRWPRFERFCQRCNYGNQDWYWKKRIVLIDYFYSAELSCLIFATF